MRKNTALTVNTPNNGPSTPPIIAPYTLNVSESPTNSSSTSIPENKSTSRIFNQDQMMNKTTIVPIAPQIIGLSLISLNCSVGLVIIPNNDGFYIALYIDILSASSNYKISNYS